MNRYKRRPAHSEISAINNLKVIIPPIVIKDIPFIERDTNICNDNNYLWITRRW